MRSTYLREQQCGMLSCGSALPGEHFFHLACYSPLCPSLSSSQQLFSSVSYSLQPSFQTKVVSKRLSKQHNTQKFLILRTAATIMPLTTSLYPHCAQMPCCYHHANRRQRKCFLVFTSCVNVRMLPVANSPLHYLKLSSPAPLTQQHIPACVKDF